MKKIFAVIFVLCFVISGAYASGKYKLYDPYEGELKNEVLETKNVSSSDISIVRKKLKPRSNLANYSMGYEYIIKNNTGHDITIKRIDSADRITSGGAFGRSFIPQKSDFVPGFNIAKSIQTDNETDKFMRRLPENETIKANDSMRVLLLAPRTEKHSATFVFNNKGKEVSIPVE
ncbi:hypothetical protein IKQ26_08390 [bacterium]|nr:hypothetical protein [bacterium]